MSNAVTQAATSRTCLITGGNSGLGYAISLELARAKQRVYMLCRDELKGRKAVDSVKQATGNAAVYLLKADLGELSSIKMAVKELLSQEQKLDCLVNNASVLPKLHELTASGIEKSFAVNHLGHFYLTHLLLDSMRQAATENCTTSQILNITSVTHRYGHLSFDDLKNQYSFQPLLAYSRSKLAQILFTYSLHQRVVDQGIAVNCLHPGSLRTSIFRHQRAFLRGFNRIFSRSPTRIARFIAQFLLSPESGKISGNYFQGTRIKLSSSESCDPLLAEKVWQLSNRLIGNEEQTPIASDACTNDKNVDSYQLLTKGV